MKTWADPKSYKGVSERRASAPGSPSPQSSTHSGAGNAEDGRKSPRRSTPSGGAGVPLVAGISHVSAHQASLGFPFTPFTGQRSTEKLKNRNGRRQCESPQLAEMGVAAHGSLPSDWSSLGILPIHWSPVRKKAGRVGERPPGECSA